jgi:peptidoglycan/xylan/chitin deacetylase (PgdA/CDA1 family)
MVGTVTLSVEVELAWGGHDLDNYDEFMESHSERRRIETRSLERLLEWCDEYGVPISFDVVGHLLLESCERDHEGPHESWWFDRDPATSVNDNPNYYAPDLIQRIDEADVDHEICTHTFSHVPCAEVPEEVVDWELERVRELHNEHLGEDIVSMVPPRHSEPPKDVLADHGIEIVRMPEDWSLTPTKLHYVYEVLFGSHPVVEPEMNDGVLVSYSTLKGSLNAGHLANGQQQVHPVFRAIPVRIRQYLQRRYFREAVKGAIAKDSYAHLYTHLHDIANDYQLKPIEYLLRTLENRRRQGNLEVLTMTELSKDFDQGKPAR